MKVLSIQEAWEMRHRDHGVLTVPEDVRAELRRGLELRAQQGGGSLAVANRARRLAQGQVSEGDLANLLAHFDGLEKAAGDEVATALHGGLPARRWLSCIARPAPPAAEREPLERRVQHTLDTHGAEGVPLTAFRTHVDQFGHQAVVKALRSLGALHQGGRVMPRPSPPTMLQIKPAEVPRGWRTFQFRGLGGL